MSIDNGALRRLLHLAEENKKIAQLEGSDAAYTVFAASLWALIRELTIEVIKQREDIYGSWEPLERAIHTPMDTRDDYPYKDSVALVNHNTTTEK